MDESGDHENRLSVSWLLYDVSKRSFLVVHKSKRKVSFVIIKVKFCNFFGIHGKALAKRNSLVHNKNKEYFVQGSKLPVKGGWIRWQNYRDNGKPESL